MMRGKGLSCPPLWLNSPHFSTELWCIISPIYYNVITVISVRMPGGRDGKNIGAFSFILHMTACLIIHCGSGGLCGGRAAGGAGKWIKGTAESGGKLRLEKRYKGWVRRVASILRCFSPPSSPHA